MSMTFKNRLLASLLLVALLFCCAVAAAEDFPCTGFLKSQAPLRKSASESAATVCTLPMGDAVYITGDSGNYYIVEYEGSAGFVLKSCVALQNDALVNTPSDSAYLTRYTALYTGQEGQAVRDLQSALIELGFLKGQADGKYGEKTEQAVAAFQQMNGLNASGSADAATQGLLFEGKPKNSAGKAKTVSIAPSVEGFPVSSGKTGDLVSKVQTALKALDYYTGKVDGKCGTGTVSAIKRFQQKNGLTASGIADAQTQLLLFSGTALSAAATATPAPTATPIPDVIGWTNGVPDTQALFPFETTTLSSVNLRKKPSTSATRLLSIPKGATVTVLSVQGDFLNVTYQTSKKTYTGYVMAQYVDVPAVYLGGEELQADADAQKRYTSMSLGATGQHVTVLQDALRELGYYSAASGAVYDAATQSAVKAFQRENGLLQTGIASAELQKLIYEGTPLNARGKKVSVAVLPPLSGVSMRQGDVGYQVEELKEALSALGYYSGVINTTFDAATAKAVKAFQTANGLTADGIVGTRTLQKLGNLLTTPTPTLRIVTPTPAPITAENVIIIHSGTRGVPVTRLQERLVELGYYDITPDGIYNANDITAVRAFQKKNGLTVDGVAGLETQLLLYADSALPAWATPTPKPTASPTPAPTEKPNTSVTLTIGSSGKEVNLLQARLTALGYFTQTIDGRYGTKTAAAVAAFQENNGLKADGIAGTATLTKLYANNAAHAPEATPTPTPTTQTQSVQLGDRGESVKAVQKMLINLGYLSGGADGIFGPKTALAVKAFQRDNLLTADGIVGAKTLARLQALAEEDTVSESVTPPDSAVSGTSFTPPTAAEVRFANWYSEIRPLARTMPNAIVYDFETGLYYHVNMFSFGKHCDAEPITASDTAVMRQIMGKDNWTPHAVWVIFSDGKVYMASTHSKGHEVDHTSGNDLEGHICIHFPRELDEAAETGPYALSHQYEILDGWERTEAMITY